MNVLEEPAATTTIIAEHPDNGGSTFLQNIGKHLPDAHTEFLGLWTFSIVRYCKEFLRIPDDGKSPKPQ
jgi:hypothetical protein